MEKQLVLEEISLLLVQSNPWLSAGHSIHPTTFPSLPYFHPYSELLPGAQKPAEILMQVSSSWWVLPSSGVP